MKDFEPLPPGFAAGNFTSADCAISSEAIEHVMAAVRGAGDAAEKVAVCAQNRLGSFPNRGAVFVESEFVEDQVAGEAAGSTGIGWKNFYSADLTIGFEADFVVHAIELRG